MVSAVYGSPFNPRNAAHLQAGYSEQTMMIIDFSKIFMNLM